MEKKSVDQDIIDRLLLAKDFLDKVRFLPNANPDRYVTARNILNAHDAAELAIAGIIHYLGLTPRNQKTYLMDYIALVHDEFPDEQVPGNGFFSQLNIARNGIKHNGVFPDTKQWFRVGDKTYDYISEWCLRYLQLSFDDIDESDMISDIEVKTKYEEAKKAYEMGDYKRVLEELAFALHQLFGNSQALRNLKVGIPQAEDALKLAAFGVHANEFLVLQEFLPSVYNYFLGEENKLALSWSQEEYGHPANWRENAAAFCLKTFLNIVLCIQDAEWIPGPINFDWVYEYKVTALEDNVEIVNERASLGLMGPSERKVLLVLSKGQSITGQIKSKYELAEALTSQRLGKEYKSILSFKNYDERIYGEIEADKVHIEAVPKQDKFVKEYFPDLPDLELKNYNRKTFLF